MKTYEKKEYKSGIAIFCDGKIMSLTEILAELKKKECVSFCSVEPKALNVNQLVAFFGFNNLCCKFMGNSMSLITLYFI